MKRYRWAILATGEVAKNMVQALHSSEHAEVVAVASRTQKRADAFGSEWNIPKCYGDYQAVAEDSEVDVVYIATPHNLHYENMQMCLQAGKHVLCEKAFTLNARQAEACINLARQKGLFLMEAMWMRFFPAMAQVRNWLQQGLLGEIRLVQADFCFQLPYDPQHRLYNLELGGGALLDLGIYPLSLTVMVLGFPHSMLSHAHISQTGADELDTILLNYDQGASASLSCSMRLYKPREAFIVGTHGYTKVHNIFFRPDRLTLHLHGQEPLTSDHPIAGNGYIYEVEEVHSCLRAKITESPLMPLDETLGLMRLMDSLRADWGLVYPDEQ
ncbi:MAG: Gfo/Idh/MocA family oxidoreductase [Chloroflexi bacterium]|nr:Gfo/Idh/MocA family oxidoreductase [Chloroflexota bacterium]